MRGCWISKPALLKRMRHRIRLAAPLPLAHQARQPAQRLLIEAQRLAHFARRRLAAIGDDVGRHRRAQFAVALIHILNRLLALLFRRQIEIDVRPLAAALAQKALEQQFHAHRIDGRNLQRIADRRIRRAAASLHQDVVALAELHDVPDDQKISCKPQLRDQRKFMLHLLLRAFQQGRDRSSRHSVASRLLPRACAESYPSSRRPAPDSAETRNQDRSAQTCSRDDRLTVFFDRARHIAKQRSHLSRRAQMPLAVHRQQPSRMIEIGVIAHRGKQIQHLAVICRRIANAIGRKHRQLQ